MINDCVLLRMNNQNTMIEDQANSQESTNFYSLYKEDATLKKQTQPCKFKDLIRFANILDRLLMALGCFFALGNGISLIFYAQPLKDLITAFDPHSNPEQILANLTSAIKAFGINSIFVFFNASLMTIMWTLTSQRQLIRVRNQYFKSLLIQQFAWYDRNMPQSVCSQMYSQTQRAQNSIVESITGILTSLSMAFGGIIFAFSRGWKMAIVMVGFLPVMLLKNYFVNKISRKWQDQLFKNSTSNNSNVMQVIENIKTVKYLGGEDYEIDRFTNEIHSNSQQLKKYKKKTAITDSINFFCIIFNYALGFWYGAKLVADKTYNTNSGKNYDVGDIISIFFCVYISNLSISGISGHFTNFYNSRVALSHIINIIDRKPRQSNGYQPCISQIDEIEFKNINFQFSQPLFKNLNLNIKKGVVAIVGSSGNGKSTLLNLLMKFYQPFKGEIYLKNHENIQNIKNIQEKSLRNKIGYVGQQPVLLGKTVRQVLGHENLSNQALWKALSICCAQQFVRNIGLDESFQGLSGGQKQRIAIARAVLRDPQVLILDEGTSALDGINEKKVLKNLKEKSKIKFIIMIAHRTETLSQAHTIIKVDKGNAEIIQHNDKEIQLFAQHKQDKEQQKEQQKEKQQNKEAQIKEQAEQSKPKFKFSYFRSLLRLNRSMFKQYVLGIITSMFLGAIFPSFSYIITRLCSLVTDIQYASSEQEVQSLRNKASEISLMLIFISIGSIFLTIMKGYSFLNLSESIGLKTKIYAFNRIVKMQMIDIDRIGKTNLIHVINNNVLGAKELVSGLIANMAEHFFTLIAGLSISFIYCWQITLVSLFLIPLSLIGGKLQQKFLSGLTQNSDKVHRKTHQIVTQSIVYNRTVKSLNLQDYYYQKYRKEQSKGFRKSIKDSIFSGITLGISQCLISGMLSVIYYIGALLVEHQGVSIVNLFTAIYAIMFSGVQAGCNIGFVSSITTNTFGTARFFSVLNVSEAEIESSFERKQKKDELIQELQDESVIANESEIKGNVEFKNISFKYPNRNEYLFRNLSFTVKQKQRVAIVGQSGTGKTTIADLLFKIYRADEGEVLIDGINTNFYSRTSLAQHLSIVSQQPALFNRSIEENIKYNSQATMKEIQEAAKVALAYDFIEKGGFGIEAAKEIDVKEQSSNWKRLVGSRGSLLSGGQKQRVAISRAIVRKPKVMVFDEATSALDKQTEYSLLKNINSTLQMTQIIIAHRLSTIQSCNSIIVLKEGKVVEIGEYEELVNKNGQFAKLVNALKDQQKA